MALRRGVFDLETAQSGYSRVLSRLDPKRITASCIDFFNKLEIDPNHYLTQARGVTNFKDGMTSQDLLVGLVPQKDIPPGAVTVADLFKMLPDTTALSPYGTNTIYLTGVSSGAASIGHELLHKVSSAIDNDYLFYKLDIDPTNPNGGRAITDAFGTACLQ